MNTVFKGLGCIGTDYKIEVDDVKPVISTARRWPISKVYTSKEKLFEMEEAKIIKHVEKATPCVSNMIAVERKDKIRICLDHVHTINIAIHFRRAVATGCRCWQMVKYFLWWMH